MAKKIIYALVDPNTLEIKYVGQSENPIRRYTSHLTDKKCFEKHQWVKNLLAKGLRPLLVALEVLHNPTILHLMYTEKRYAQQALKDGNKLFNDLKFVTG